MENNYDVFVYCGGKCGSSPLHTTFINNGYKSLHIHDNNYYRKIYKENNNTIFDLIDNSCKDKKVYIIDSYRTPIERKISSFFQNITIHLPEYKNMSVEELIIYFNEYHLAILEENHSQDEVLEHYNIPLFTTFDFAKGYNIVEKDNKVFIKLLFRDIKRWGDILSEIMCKEIVIHSNNLTENKDTYGLYSEFKNKYKVPSSYMHHLVENDIHFKIYNTIEEQNTYPTKFTFL